MARNLKKHALERWADTCIQKASDGTTFAGMFVDSTVRALLKRDNTPTSTIVGVVCQLTLASSLITGTGHIVRMSDELADDVMATEPDDKSAEVMLNGHLPWPIFALVMPKDEDYQAVVTTTADYLLATLDHTFETLELPQDMLIPIKERIEARTTDEDSPSVVFGLVPGEDMLQRQGVILADKTVATLKENDMFMKLPSGTLIDAQAPDDDALRKLAQTMAGLPFDMHLIATTLPGHTDNPMPTISLIAFVCAENAEMRTTYEPGPEPKSPAKRRQRSRATWHECGITWTDAYRDYRRAKSASRSLGGSLRPHIRRAHWHHFWRGPRHGQRELVCHWIPPTLVKGKLGQQQNQGHVIAKKGGKS